MIAGVWLLRLMARAIAAVVSVVLFTVTHPIVAFYSLLHFASRTVYLLCILTCIGLAVLAVVGSPITIWGIGLAAVLAIISRGLHRRVIEPAILRRLHHT